MFGGCDLLGPLSSGDRVIRAGRLSWIWRVALLASINYRHLETALQCREIERAIKNLELSTELIKSEQFYIAESFTYKDSEVARRKEGGVGREDTVPRHATGFLGFDFSISLHIPQFER